jgi:hypothetical protein
MQVKVLSKRGLKSHQAVHSAVVLRYQITFHVLFEVSGMKYRIFIIFVLIVGVVGCAGNPTSSLAKQCDAGLSAAHKELDYAKTNGLSGTVEYTKAASLLGAAKIQSEFGKYPNCIDKVNRARAYIRKSQQ